MAFSAQPSKGRKKKKGGDTARENKSRTGEMVKELASVGGKEKLPISSASTAEGAADEDISTEKLLSADVVIKSSIALSTAPSTKPGLAASGEFASSGEKTEKRKKKKKEAIRDNKCSTAACEGTVPGPTEAKGAKGTARAKRSSAGGESKQSKPKLPEQQLADLDINSLTPLSPLVMARQATINIGTQEGGKKSHVLILVGTDGE